MNNYVEDSSMPDQDKIEKIDLFPNVKSFTTTHGSIYKKLPDGTFRRDKYDGQKYEPMEWTMFTDNEGVNVIRMALLKKKMAQSGLNESVKNKKYLFALAEYDRSNWDEEGEYVADDDIRSLQIIYHKPEIIDPKNVFDLVVFEATNPEDVKLILQTAITFTPKKGYTVFEFDADDMSDHLGDKVVEIETEN